MEAEESPIRRGTDPPLNEPLANASVGKVSTLSGKPPNLERAFLPLFRRLRE